MRRAAPSPTLLCACLAAVVLSACADGSSVLGPRFDATMTAVDAATDGADDFTPPPLDRPRTDVSTSDVTAGCDDDRGCPRGQRCLQGRCSEDVCLASETPCGADRCDMRCVPVRDLCADVRCNPDETCFAGRCVAGCFPAPCAGITCAAGQFCDDTTGRCTRVTPCPGRCADGFTCHVRCTQRSACDGVACGVDEVCAEGRCVPNPCARVSCPAGALCVDGRCVPTCGCDPPCTRSPRDRCVVGRCQCDRLCQADTPCGTDDGCGGRCVGPCPNPFATCDPVLFSCACTNRCTPLSACGEDDGCGGRCSSGCGVGERCDTTLRRCICVSRCPPGERALEVPCGEVVANECEGAPPCGLGLACAAGQVCNVEARRCECAGSGCEPPGDGSMPMSEDASAGGGDGGGLGGCAPSMLVCAGRCTAVMTDPANCGACGARCPSGTTCSGGMCRCPSPFTLCGDRCVSLATDPENCGACGTLCTGRTSCDTGRCQCIPACLVDPNSVACGTELANACPGGPSCGVGRACASGEVCDTTLRRCVCVPRCPPGVRCGTADGCGGQCAGACETGTCTRDGVDPRRYACSEASCVSGCRCDEVCASNRCVPITCATGDRPCPCQCCPAGQMCVGGTACVPIPP